MKILNKQDLVRWKGIEVIHHFDLLVLLWEDNDVERDYELIFLGIKVKHI